MLAESSQPWSLRRKQTAGRRDAAADNIHLPLAWWDTRENSRTRSVMRAPEIDHQKAMIYSASRTSKSIQHVHSIYPSTFGILFLGIPHDGSNKAKPGSTGRRMVGASTMKCFYSSSLEPVSTMQPSVEKFTRVMVCFSTPVSSTFWPVGNRMRGNR